MLKRVIAFGHDLLMQTVLPGETVIDGTCGNGNDTVMLSKLVGTKGKVIAFDIQDQAITNTRTLLQNQAIQNVKLIKDSHQNVLNYVKETEHGKVGGAIFNLGYLPGSDKKIITEPNSTIKAIDDILNILKIGGIIVLVVYHGHPGGEIEKDALLTHLSKLDQKQYSVISYGFINQKNHPPFVLAIEKKS